MPTVYNMVVDLPGLIAYARSATNLEIEEVVPAVCRDVHLRAAAVSGPVSKCPTFANSHSHAFPGIHHIDCSLVFKIVAYSVSCLLVYRSVPLVRAPLRYSGRRSAFGARRTRKDRLSGFLAHGH